MSNGGTPSCRNDSMVAELSAELSRHPLRQPEVTLEADGELEQEDECSTLRQVSVANRLKFRPLPTSTASPFY